jgi:hypothetical protein
LAVARERLFIRAKPLGALWLVLVGAASAGFLVLMDRTSYDTWGAVIIAPILLLVSIPALRHQAAREGDPRLFAVLMCALVLKLGASLVRYFVAVGVYGSGDSVRYMNDGAQIAAQFHRFDFAIGPIRGTGFPSFLTGLVYTVTWPTRIGAFLVFSWIAFWGLFLFYRAFTIAVPEGRRTTYARLVFFLPSLVYWPSSVGKDAWMVFGLGLAAFGVAKLLTAGVAKAVVPLLLGIGATAIVRPPVAAMIAGAVVVAYVLRPSRPQQGELAPVFKVIVLIGLAVGMLFLVRLTNNFLVRAGVSEEGGITDTMQNTMFRTQQGGSSFQPSVLDRPSQAPMAVITVLFRPLIPDANSAQGLLAALEGTFLLAWSIWRWRWVWHASLSIRRQPYVATALSFTAVFIFGFSSIANFGILARERTQVLPFYLVLLAVPTPEWWERHRTQKEVARADAQPVA